MRMEAWKEDQGQERKSKSFFLPTYDGLLTWFPNVLFFSLGVSMLR